MMEMDYDTLQVVLGQSVGWADGNGLRFITSGVGTTCRMGGWKWITIHYKWYWDKVLDGWMEMDYDSLQVVLDKV